MADEQQSTNPSTDTGRPRSHRDPYVTIDRLGRKLRELDHNQKDADARAQVEKERADKAEAEAARWRQAADNNAAAKEVGRLQQLLRDQRHKEAFTAAMVRAKVAPERMEAFRKLAEYQPQTDEPDPLVIEGVIETMRATHDYLFAKPTATPPPAAESPTAPAAQAREALNPERPNAPGPAAGKGETQAAGGPLKIDPDTTNVALAMKNYNAYIEANRTSRERDGGYAEGWQSSSS